MRLLVHLGDSTTILITEVLIFGRLSASTLKNLFFIFVFHILAPRKSGGWGKENFKGSYEIYILI